MTITPTTPTSNEGLPEMFADKCAALLGLFVAARVAVLAVEYLPNQHWPPGAEYDDVRVPWLRVTTPLGPVIIGWRKRVISIDWSESTITKPGDKVVAEDWITHGARMCHAYNYAQAAQCIARLDIPNADDAAVRLAAAEAELKEAQETEVECISKLMPLLADHPSEPRIDKLGPSFVDGAGKERARRDLSLSTACDLLADVAARLAELEAERREVDRILDNVTAGRDAAATNGADKTKPAPGYEIQPRAIGCILISPSGTTAWCADEALAIRESHRIYAAECRPAVEAATAGLRAEWAEEKRLLMLLLDERADLMNEMRAEVARLTALVVAMDNDEYDAIAVARKDERAATERDIAEEFGEAVCAGERIGPLVLASDYPKADPKAAAPTENGHSEETP